MISGLSMKPAWACPRFIVIIPKITFAVLNFVFQQARERWGVSAACEATVKKDGSDPISTRRHFAERLDGTGKM